MQETIRLIIGRNESTSSTTPSNSTSVETKKKNLVKRPEQYSGDGTAMSAQQWLYLVRQWCQGETFVDDTAKITVVSSLFKGSALNWWLSVNHKIESWEELEAQFLNRFMNPKDSDQAQIELSTVKQGTRSVKEYVVHFEKMTNL